MLVSPPLGVQAAHGAQERKATREALKREGDASRGEKTSEGNLTSLRLSFARRLPVEGTLLPGEAPLFSRLPAADFQALSSCVRAMGIPTSSAWLYNSHALISSLCVSHEENKHQGPW